MQKKINFPRPLVLIFGIGIALYCRTFFFDYTNFDDDVLIRQNQDFIGSLSNVPAAFSKTVFITGSDVFYRPIETIWFMLNAQFGGTNLFVYHLSAVLLHILAVYLIFILLKRFTDSQEVSLFLSLLFLVHPALTQAAAWIPGTVDILLAVFSLSSFLFFQNFIKSRKRKDFVLHILFFLLALYTKETAIGLVPVCLFYLHFIEKEPIASYNKKVFLPGWFVIAAVWLLMRSAVLKGQHEKGMFDMISSIAENLPGFIQYIGKILLPFNLSVMPVLKDTSYIYGIAALILFGTAVYLSKEQRSNRMGFGIFWFVIFLLPTFIHTAEFRVQQFYEHRLYLPLIGILFFAAELDWIKIFSFEKTIYKIAGTAVIVFFFVLSFLHQKVFSNTADFLDNAVNTSPNSSLAHRNMGIYLQDEIDKGGRKDTAMMKRAADEYLKSLSLNPNERDLHGNLGVLYDWMGKKSEAEKEYEAETNLNPQNPQAWHNLGIIYSERNENEKAETYLKKSIALRQNQNTYSELAKLYQKTGRQKEYEEIVMKLQGKTPPPNSSPSAEKSLTASEAEAVLLKKLAVDSLDKDALFNLGLLYYRTERKDEAQKLWRKTIKADSTFIDAYNNLAICLALQGKNTDAEKFMKKVVQINPDYINGYFNLANFYAKNGKDIDAKIYIKELKKRGAGKENFSNITPGLAKLFDEVN